MTTEAPVAEATAPTRDERLEEAGRTFLSILEGLTSTGHTFSDLLLASDMVGYERAGEHNLDLRDLTPLERTATVRRSRVYFQRNPLVDRAITFWTDTAFSKPWTYTAFDEGFQAIVDGLMRANYNRRIFNREGMKRLSNRMLVDGEVPFVFYVADPSRIHVRAMDPLEFLDPITNPEDKDETWYWPRLWADQAGTQHLWLYRDWNFTDEAGNPRTEPIPESVATALRSRGATVADLQPREGEYVAIPNINTLGVRGQPLFASALDWVRAHTQFMRDRSSLTAARAQYASTIKVKGGQSAVEGIAQSIARVQNPSDGTKPLAGQAWLQNDGVNRDLVTPPSDGQSARQDERALRMMATLPSGVPPHLMGDVGEGNLATAAATEKPLRDMLTSYQGVWMDFYEELFDHLARWSDWSGDSAVDVDAPEILPQSLIELAQALSAAATVFPALKQSPDLLKKVLTELGLNNVDQVVDELEGLLGIDGDEGAEQVMEALRVIARGERVA